MRFGIFIKCPQLEIIEACGISGLDFVVVDMEHTPLGPRDLYPLALAAERRSLEIMLRVPSASDEYIKWALDIGIKHIQVPQIESLSDATNALHSSFYGEKGHRGLCRFVRAADFSDTDKDAYLHSANATTKVTLQIEGTRGLDKLEEILQLSSLESIMIGPYDLSQSMGKPGQIWDEAVIKEMERIIAECKRKNIQVGTFTDSIEGISFWKSRGIDFLQYASDLNIFMQSIRDLKRNFSA